MHRDYVEWHSPSVGRRMELLWLGHGGRPVILFPTSGGRFVENEERSIVGSLANRIDAGEIQVVCVDGFNAESWLNQAAHPADRVRAHQAYDHYLRQELVPWIQHRAQRPDIAVYGASLGAYHAANFAGRYPDLVRRAVCFSGMFDIHRFLDGFWNDDCYFHCPTAYIPNLDADLTARVSQVQWVIATGEGDSLVEENRAFSRLLGQKGIPHHFEIWQGFGHDWPWWKEHLWRFLP